MRNVSNKCCRENQNTHFVISNFSKKIYGLTLDSDGTWRIKTNEELEMLIKIKKYCKIYKITKITL